MFLTNALNVLEAPPRHPFPHNVKGAERAGAEVTLSTEEERINNLVAESGCSRARSTSYRPPEPAGADTDREQSSLDTIKGLGSATTDEVLMPVGGGILLRASPPKTDKVLLNIGANVVVEKTRDEANKFMEARAKDIEENIIAIASQRNQIAQRLDSDRRTLQSFIDRQDQVCLCLKAQRGVLLSPQGRLRKEAL